MGPRMFQWLLLGVLIVLFMDKGTRICNECNYFDGYKCRGKMKSCWKFNFGGNRSCSTSNYYFFDRNTERYLFRYSVLSCEHCYEGMFQVYHDLLRETFCCIGQNKCNDGQANLDMTRLLGVEDD